MGALLNLPKLVVLLFLICAADSAKILGVFHMPTYSHFQLGDRIFKELAAKGHEVTVISPFELKTPVKNLKHVVLTGFADQMSDVQINMWKEANRGIISSIIWFTSWGEHLVQSVLNHSNVQKLLNSNEEFDLIILENFINEGFYGFAYRYKAPVVLISPVGSASWISPKMGNPSNPAYIPNSFVHYSSNMTFLERTANFFATETFELLNHLYIYPKHNNVLQKFFPGAPHLYDLMYNTSLALLNLHSSTSDPVPLLPNMIDIGGYHVQDPKPLSKGLQDFLDNAKDGVIFFCMGSNLKVKDIPEQKRDEILRALGKLKQQVLWKWEEDVLPRQPANVKLGKWFPQVDILAHPNVKLFITHGGMLSTIEAIYYGVPVLGIPVYGDQETNMLNAERAGYGVSLPYTKVNEATLSAALNEVLSNPKYKQNALQKANIMHDQPMKPLDKAIFWIEYVIRHKGAPHLRTAALNLQWYQLILLDVVAVLTVGLVVFVWLFVKVLQVLRVKITRSSTDKKKKLN